MRIHASYKTSIMIKMILKGSVLALPFLISITFSCASVFASENISELKGALRTGWYNLGHYDASGVSEITNDSFFVAPTGRYDAQAEYDAFVNLVKRYHDSKQDDDLLSLCRYPARLTFLQKNTEFLSEENFPYCESYRNSRKPEQIESISMIFASGYFDNPSSYYGHTLLRFNYGDDVVDQKTLDASLNYGAEFDESDSPALYVVNGLFGGYMATYRANNDFIHSHRYTNGQLRDLWEYKIKLTADQIRFVSEHSWELSNAQFDYYFLNDNCAHRVINVVERATGHDLTKAHGFWLMPLQVVQELRDVEGGALLQEENYYPSLKSVFSRQYAALSDADKESFIAFLKQDNAEQKQQAKLLSSELLALLLDHYNIKSAQLSIKKRSNQERRQDINNYRRIILFELLSRPADSMKAFAEDDTTDKSLLDIPNISVLRTGIVRRDGESFVNARYQVANNDLLSYRQPGQERSRFIMGAIEADIGVSGDGSDRFDLRELVVFDLANLNTNPLPMSETKEYSWGIKLGYSQRNVACTGCGSVALDAKIGKAHRFNDHVMIYSLNGARLNHKKIDDYGYAYLVSENGIGVDVSDLRFDISVDASYDPIEEQDDYLIGMEVAKGLTQNSDLRLMVADGFDQGKVLSLKLGYHFN